MRALAKLVSVNNPDRVLFVGEALVGNEAVDQLSKFDRALRDFSGMGGVSKGRGIDGMVVTKWDTVDDKVGSPFFFVHPTGTDERYQRSQVGAALSMTFVTGQPIVFVGTGQVCCTSFPGTTRTQRNNYRLIRIYDSCACRTLCRPF